MFPKTMTRLLHAAVFAAASAGTLQAQTGTPEAPFPVRCGESAATAFSNFVQPFNPFSGINLNNPVVMVIDNRIPGATVPDPGPGPNSWAAAMFYNASGPANHQWTAANLGQLFGVEFDNAPNPNIYVTASTGYGSDNVAYDNANTSPFATSPFPGAATGGEVYKLDGTTGNISLFATLPNAGAGGGTGPGLGNLCFSAEHGRLYITNFHDGRVYAYDLAGNCRGTFKHSTGAITTNSTGPCPADSSAVPGFAPLGERAWGVAVNNGRLYYGIWSEDRGRPSATAANTVHSIALTPTGDFSGVSQLEVTLPIFNTNWSNPVSDIMFSSQGRMMVAERVMLNDVGIGAQPATGFEGHAARNLEFELIAGVWTATAPAREFLMGNPVQFGANASGGIDFDCDDNLWSTIDQMPASSTAVYGLQRTPANGNTLATIGAVGYFIDIDQISSVQSKNRIGSVAVYRCCCMEVATEELDCVPGSTPAAYNWTFCVTNTSGQTANALSIITPSGVTLSNQAFAINPPLANGDTRCFTLVLSGLPAGQTGCFTMILRRTQTGQPSVECCRREVCITPPVCCFETSNQVVTPAPTGTDPNRVQVCLDITNETNGPGFAFHHLFIIDPDLLNPPTFNPQHFFSGSGLPVGGLLPGQTVNICFFINNPTPGTTVCFDIEVHDIDIDPCCSETVCVIIPPGQTDCACPDPCIPGAIPENEPCMQHINDVCDPFGPGSTIHTLSTRACGQVSTDAAGGADSDWWYFTGTPGATYTMTFSTQFLAQVSVNFIPQGVPCPGFPLQQFLLDPCLSVTVTFTIPDIGILAINVMPIVPPMVPCECGNYGFTITQISPACIGDEDGSGSIGLGDLAVVIQNWSTAGPAGDCNRDGVVGLADVAGLIQHWGEVCQ